MPFSNYKEPSECFIVPYDVILNHQDVEMFKIYMNGWKTLGNELLTLSEIFDRYSVEHPKKFKHKYYGRFNKLIQFGLVEHVVVNYTEKVQLKTKVKEKHRTKTCYRPTFLGEQFYIGAATVVDRIALMRRENLQNEKPLPDNHPAWLCYHGPLRVQKFITDEFSSQEKTKNEYGREKADAIGNDAVGWEGDQSVILTPQ